jgi:inhibitor of cysteine peptidase
MMHKRTILIAGLVLIALVAAGAAFAMSTDEPSEATVYTADDDGTSIVLEPGESFSVVLPGNATTGYSWQVEGIDAAILSAAEPVDVSDSELVGAGGVYTFTFTAAAAGNRIALGLPPPLGAGRAAGDLHHDGDRPLTFAIG